MAGLFDFLRSIFGPAPRVHLGTIENTRAFQIMRRFNSNGLIVSEGDFICMVEDHADPDARLFRLEYQSTPDGRSAVAWCRYNPWGSVSDAHTTNGGLICIGPGAHGPQPNGSRFDLETAILRARFWCTAISVYHETGRFPNQ